MDSTNNQNAAMLGDIVKTCDMGKTSIKQLMPYIKNREFKKLAAQQYKDYNAIGDEAVRALAAEGKPVEGAPGFSKLMSGWMIAMQGMRKNSEHELVSMLLRGNSSGIAKTGGNLNHLKNVQPQTRELAQKLLKAEQKNEQELIPYL